MKAKEMWVVMKERREEREREIQRDEEIKQK